ncbi:hypothetical protein PR048_026428 [Dryococelus australis]|uniref:Uncharacterized protein n=1 Tax=Dryococelus australis TaxID=614101 RepID=A0ABQ9GLD4_9NEOP|nr:hypothetical protein PR048_026428 [Dryococelus australis]
MEHYLKQLIKNKNIFSNYITIRHSMRMMRTAGYVHHEPSKWQNIGQRYKKWFFQLQRTPTITQCALNNEKSMFNKCEFCPAGKEAKQVLCVNGEEVDDDDDDDYETEIKCH